MTDRPIIFSAPMVRALLEGRKTQTRRLATSPLRRCEVGDRLYVREAFSATFWTPDDIDGAPREFWATPKNERAADLCSDRYYRLDEEAKDFPRFLPEGQWTPSIHMPRWASRLTLVVEAVNVERLNDISDDDAWAEGICQAVEDTEPGGFGACSPEQRRGIVEATYGSGAKAFSWLWESLHGAGSWDANPWVVALTFRVERGNIDRIAA